MSTIILPLPRPPKGLSANDRTHWSVRARESVKLRMQVTRLVEHMEPMQRCRVEIVWVVRDQRRRDADNPDPMCKAIYDAIGSDRGVGARLVPDDAPEYMEKPRLRIEYRPGCDPHFEVTITDLSGEKL